MITGGLALILAGALRGELGSLEVNAFSTKSMLAWAYLVVAGALIGFTAYIWLLQVSTPAKVSTYAYVNPIIAVFLGVWLGKESLSTHTLAGAVLVVVSVIIILRAPARPPTPAVSRAPVSHDATPAQPVGRP
jgi:drug/metabolite transporter (DMT)-like permease